MSLPTPKPVTSRAAVYFALSLAVRALLTTYLVMTHITDPHAWWAVLTLFVVVQPAYTASMARAAVWV